jgi:hypothetical protein
VCCGTRAVARLWAGRRLLSIIARSHE